MDVGTKGKLLNLVVWAPVVLLVKAKGDPAGPLAVLAVEANLVSTGKRDSPLSEPG